VNVLLFFIFIYLYKSCKRLSAVKHSPPLHSSICVAANTTQSKFQGHAFESCFWQSRDYEWWIAKSLDSRSSQVFGPKKIGEFHLSMYYCIPGCKTLTVHCLSAAKSCCTVLSPYFADPLSHRCRHCICLRFSLHWCCKLQYPHAILSAIPTIFLKWNETKCNSKY
jgi:hypothetical protein